MKKFISEGFEFIKSELNLSIEKSLLKFYSPQNWKIFCKLNNLNATSEGLYVPQTYSAYVRTETPFLVSNVFHEYFGHGLFCEHSEISKIMDGITEKKLYNEINPKEQIFGFTKRNIENYEGFALWLEAILCSETGNKDVWERKKSLLPDENVLLFEFFNDMELKMSRFGFVSQLGFPKHYDSEKILNVLRFIYSDGFQNIEFVVLYGSKKPKSDIDLFIVSENRSQNYFNGWLDIYELNRADFKDLASKLDISVTDPLFSGELIYGDEIVFEKTRQDIKTQQISNEAINHNLAMAKEQKNFIQKFNEGARERKISSSYSMSYARNAEELQKGEKPLTLNNLV